MKLPHYFHLSSFLFLLILFCGCECFLDDPIEKYQGNGEYVIRESRKSVNCVHQISTLCTSSGGMGIIVDDSIFKFDDVVVRYSPVVSDDGQYAWVEQQKVSGYDVIWLDKSILHSRYCLNYLTAGRTKAVCIESDNAHIRTVVYLIDMSSGEAERIALWDNEYIENISQYSDDSFGIITCSYDENGNKSYNIYSINEDSTIIKILGGIPLLTVFPKDTIHQESLTVECIKISENERFLFNALSLFREQNDAFAYGNDYRGRISWGESPRLRGLCELFEKTREVYFKDKIDAVVNGLMNARNKFTGLIINDLNPESLWSSKCYSIDNEPMSILVNNSEILSSLLYVCNKGLVVDKGIVEAAKIAVCYYEQFYFDSHYHSPNGSPVTYDGIVVPWNYQNSMAEVFLGVYLQTGEQRYLDRCNELISVFMSEWVDDDNRIYWHYWPNVFYKGWSDDGRSTHSPFKTASVDNNFEDASHAGISVRLLSRYKESIPNGVVNDRCMEKIENNMNYFCFRNGFSNYISGNESGSPRAWHNLISPYWSYLHNDEYEKYVMQGYNKCFPSWDSQVQLFANARLYRPEVPEQSITITRRQLEHDGQLKDLESFELSRNELYSYLRVFDND